MLTNWFEKKVLILGLSVSGIAAAKFLNRHGADVYITEFSQAKPEQLELIKELESLGIKVETGGHSDEFLNDAYLAVTSPSIPMDSDVMKRLKDRKIQVISEVELAFSQTNKPFIAVINKARGGERFISLLTHLGLEDRMIEDLSSCDVVKLMNMPIDWKAVNPLT